MKSAAKKCNQIFTNMTNKFNDVRLPLFPLGIDVVLILNILLKYLYILLLFPIIEPATCVPYVSFTEMVSLLFCKKIILYRYNFTLNVYQLYYLYYNINEYFLPTSAINIILTSKKSSSYCRKEDWLPIFHDRHSQN